MQDDNKAQKAMLIRKEYIMYERSITTDTISYYIYTRHSTQILIALEKRKDSKITGLMIRKKIFC